MDESAAPNVQVTEANAVLEFWQTFDLTARKESLENSCVDMREAKTASIAGRKRLNEVTKAFRAKPKEEQLPIMGDILKAYQEEIDQLSRRSKYCESTFFTLYKAIYDAPDPCECIETLMQSVVSGSAHNLEIERLRGELRQYDEEFQQLKNQDITIRRLEDQLQEFKDQNEEKIAEEVQKRAQEVESQAEAKVTEVMEVQRTVERRHAAAVDAMQIAQQSADRAQTQLYEVSSQAENRVSALQSENAILAEGTQRLTIRLAEAESELEAAKTTIAEMQRDELHHTGKHKHKSKRGSSGNNSSGDMDDDGEDEDGGLIHGEDAHTLQIVVSKLRDELAHQEELLRTEKHRLDSQNRELANQLSREKASLQKLQQELRGLPSREGYAELRRQLRVVQKIAFNVQDEDDEDDYAEGDEFDQNDESGFDAQQQEEFGEGNSGMEPESTVGSAGATASGSKTGGSMAAAAAGVLSGSGSRGAVVGRVRKQQMQLEALLTSRIKVLESELKEARRDVQHYKEQETSLKESVASMKKSLESSTQLITRLEGDLESRSAALEQAVAVAAGIKPNTQPTGSSNVTSGDSGLASLLGVEDAVDFSAASSSAAGLSANVSSSVSTNAVSGAAGVGAGQSVANNSINMQMINILQTQRDSYKERLTRAETSMQKLQRECEAAQAAKERLETDNLALYSKIRYLQSYNGANANTRITPQRNFGASSYQEEGRVNDEDYLWERGAGAGAGGLTSVSNTPATAGARLMMMMRGGGGVETNAAEIESRYHSLYEQRMNPFEQFSQHEKQRKLQELSVADRIVLNTTMAIVSSHAGRTFLLVYMGLMHLLVFVIIYYTAHHVHAGCDPSLDHHAATTAAISSAVANIAAAAAANPQLQQPAQPPQLH